MGWRSRLNQAEKKRELEKNPHLARRVDVQKKLEDFYYRNRFVAPHVKEKIEEIRKKCEQDIALLSKKADEDITRTEAIYMEKELELVAGYEPEPEKKNPVGKWWQALLALAGRG